MYLQLKNDRFGSNPQISSRCTIGGRGYRGANAGFVLRPGILSSLETRLDDTVSRDYQYADMLFTVMDGIEMPDPEREGSANIHRDFLNIAREYYG